MFFFSNDKVKLPPNLIKHNRELLNCLFELDGVRYSNSLQCGRFRVARECQNISAMLGFQNQPDANLVARTSYYPQSSSVFKIQYGGYSARPK